MDTGITERRRLKRLGDAHDAAVEGCLALASRIPREAWQSRACLEGWTLAEELEHVMRSHELALATLRGGLEPRPMASGKRARLLRTVVLPIILFTGWFPRAEAPSETRPLRGDVPLAPQQVATRLEAAARQLAILIRTPGRLAAARRVRHPYFGPLPGADLVRLLTAHLRHHTNRMEQRVAREARPASVLPLHGPPERPTAELLGAGDELP